MIYPLITKLLLATIPISVVSASMVMLIFKPTVFGLSSTKLFNSILILEDKINTEETQQAKVVGTPIKCVVESEQTEVNCLISKLESVDTNKWIDMNKINEGLFSSSVESNYFLNKDALYRLKINKDYFTNTKSKELSTIKVIDKADPSHVLAILNPKLTIDSESKLTGKLSYFAAKATDTSKTSATIKSALSNTNNSFKCSLTDLPTAKNHDCNVFKLNGSDGNAKSALQFNALQAIAPSLPAISISKDFYYFIKFEEPVSIDAMMFNENSKIYLHIYKNDIERAKILLDQKIIFEDAEPILFHSQKSNKIALHLKNAPPSKTKAKKD